MPFNGPVGAARVGYKNGQYILNPTFEELENSQLNLVVAGTKEAVIMVESEAEQLSEAVMLGAVMFGHEQMQVAISAIEELVAEAGVPVGIGNRRPRSGLRTAYYRVSAKFWKRLIVFRKRARAKIAWRKFANKLLNNVVILQTWPLPTHLLPHV